MPKSRQAKQGHRVNTVPDGEDEPEVVDAYRHPGRSIPLTNSNAEKWVAADGFRTRFPDQHAEPARLAVEREMRDVEGGERLVQSRPRRHPFRRERGPAAGLGLDAAEGQEQVDDSCPDRWRCRRP